MNSLLRHRALIFGVLAGLLTWLAFLLPHMVVAKNVIEYKDQLTDSAPLERSNHTFSFILNTSLAPSSVIEITPPDGFDVLSTSNFAERNVELVVDGMPRTSDVSASPGVDMIEITTGSPGFFRYTLAPDTGISSGSRLEFRIGNHTSTALQPVTSFSTSTGTTTSPGDTEPIVNSAITGVHEVQMEIFNGGLVANADFVIFLNDKVSIPNIDTTETIPPFRFNGAPSSTVGGTTLNVEISLETDEFAVCKYSLTPGVDYAAMSKSFTNSGFVFHSTVVTVTPSSIQSFYVRCIDDEGNFNIDDYLITFSVHNAPTGNPNTDGDVEGDGTGTGNDGTGTGGGGGGTTGSSDGSQPNEGSSSGSGGSGGGGGGGKGKDSDNGSGGGFESSDAAYRSGDGRVEISGFAYPNSTVSILVDGNFYKTTKTNGSGVYAITLDEIARGVYTFGVYAEDANKVRSSTFSTSFTVTGARTSALSNINVSPTIKVSPDPVDPGQTLTISGYTLPNATVTIENGRINKSSSQTLSATSDSSGRWSTTADTNGFTKDTYQVRAKAVQSSTISTQFSKYTFYGVGQSADVPLNADLNRDGKVNLVDFSILLFWWNTDGGDSNPPADINNDKKVSLTDFSILLFNWTG